MKTAALLHQSVSGLLDDPLKENKSSASFYLTMHCLMLVLFAILLFDKYYFDPLATFKSAWPIQSTNPRNPLSAGGILAITIGGSFFVFWSIVGKSKSAVRIGLPHYLSISYASAIFVNVPLLYIGLELDFPELSLVLGSVNFLAWARWSVRKYLALTSPQGLRSNAA